ncbi:MAG: carbohydrate-binding domain-containing protein [Treponema sp.]|nr:carbohydrate-binding domain-containing protein [Treponema sp.]
MKKSILTAISLAAIFFMGCNSSTSSTSESTESDTVDSTATATSTYTANESDRDITTADYVSNVSFTDTLYINLATPAYSTDNSSFTTITESEAEPISEITVCLSDTVVYIESSKNYTSNLKLVLTGDSSASPISIKAKAEINLGIYLNGVNISSGNYPAIEVKGNAETTYLVLEGTNTLTDGRSYGTGYSEAEGTDYYTSSYSGTAEDGAELTANWALGADAKGTLYTKGALIISGSGSLTVTEGYKHAIYSKDYIQVLGGTINTVSTGRNGIQSVNGFIMEDGDITISGTGENTNNESRGIIVEGSEDEDYKGEGFIEIHGGSIDISTVSKAISAKWDIDEDAETTSDTNDDPYPYVKITGGTISITTSGTPKDESSSTYSVMNADGVTESETTKLSPEGIEGKQAIYISGGNITIETTDDGINASRDGYADLEISGGKIYVYSSDNDAIDSNGTLTISGGTIVALTATNPECAFDCDSYTFAITGGTFVGIGTSNYSTPTASACSQSTYVLSGNYFGAGGTTMALTDDSGDAVFAYTIPSSIFGTSSSSSYIMILSSDEIETGTSYDVMSGVTVSGGSAFNGLYTSLPSVSGGSTTISGTSTSTSSYVYTKSSSSNGGAQEGSHTNNGPGN